MNIERTHDEIAELLGVYALDAVDDEERAAVEAHLASCPRCAAEVAEHREVAAQLANDGGAAPEGVWQRIVDSLEEAPPSFDLLDERRRREGPEATVSPLAPRRSFRQWLPLSAAAAVLVVAGLVAGITLAGDGGSSERDRTQHSDVARAAHDDPDSVRVDLRSPDDDVRATAVVAPDGSGYILGSSLPELDDDRTYQLWGVREGAVISLGILGNEPEVVAFHMDQSIEALAITAEVAGGVEKSANDAVVVGETTA